MARGTELIEIADGEANRVADFAISLAELGHHPLAHFHVGLVFLGGNPEAQHVGAPLVPDFRGQDDVAEGFGHGAALLVEGPAMGDDAAIRRLVADAGGDQQRTMEPPAVLVGAFEVHVSGPFVAFEDG